MKQITSIILLLFATYTMAQTGTIQGIVLDKEAGNEPLPFANVFIQDSQTGTSTDMDGAFEFRVEPGTYTLVFTFVGYEKVELPNIIVNAGEVTTIDNVIMVATQGVSLDEVVVKAETAKESESALLAEQKKATVIKESIGAVRLSKIGVSDAATATTKISGVTKNEGSGDIYIRGLGDRYLSTTMNGLPIPSDDVEKKNIDLNLFSTNIIQNVSISKTYNTDSYADQASGTVDITPKEYNKNTASVRIGAGVNSNVATSDIWSNFKATQNINDLTLGFYKKPYRLEDAITYQSWNTEKRDNPLNTNIAVSAEKRFTLFNKSISLAFTASHRNDFDYRQGIFKKYRSNVLDNSFTDAETFRSTINTTAHFNAGIRLNEDHKLNYNYLFVNKTIDNLYEQGRNGEGYVFDQDPQEYGAFVRDQNTKQTRMFINQLLGEHRLGEKNELNWAIGYNFVSADEPNRIRNEVNILDENTVQFAHVGDFQQRKSSQVIEDEEINGLIKDQLTLKNEENTMLKLNLGANYRNKERYFESLFIGVRAKDFQVASIDNLSEAFTRNNFSSGALTLRTREKDTYNASLTAAAGFANLDFSYYKWSGNIGARYEGDEINVSWNVANYVGRVGETTKNYTNVLPSLNLKYELNDANFLRFAASQTVTLPEFKELAPFEYVSPVGRVTKGNPDLVQSKNLNIDVKYELFPSSGELISLTGFYKQIKDPINLTQTRGSSGNFVYDNTGEKADVVGLEFETRLDLIKNDGEEKGSLNLNVNATKMWFNQDLFEEFQYKGKTESDLQGASDFILNTALSYSTNKEKEFNATLAANYSSDKVFALGAPEDFANSTVLYNDEIIEKGFLTLDAVLSKDLSERLSLRLTAKNLLNPSIEQTQLVRNITTEIERNEVVSSYKKGAVYALSLRYTF